jgi:pimeloyl-ACP methyl ester carboxylesterase
MSNALLYQDRFAAGIVDASQTPRTFAKRPPILMLHGAGTVDASVIVGGIGTHPKTDILVHALAEDGWPVMGTTHTNLWAPTGGLTLTRITAAIAYARANFKASNAPAIVMGMSMGAHISLRYHKVYGATALVGFIPAINLTAMRALNNAGIRSQVDLMYGVTYPAALPAGVDPYLDTASYTTLPMSFWGASDDPYCLPSYLTNFCTATGGVQHNVGALGHTDAAIGAADIPTILTFLDQFKDA